jgi:hypothetical protein
VVAAGAQYTAGVHSPRRARIARDEKRPAARAVSATADQERGPMELPSFDLLKLIAVAGALVIALYGVNRVDARLKAKNQGLGANALRAFGLVIFIPTLVILAIVTDMRTDVLAALLGTIAGYALSHSAPDNE